MGIFYEQVDVFNRAPIHLNVRFDGQDINVKPGRASIPRIALEYAMRQNTINGSADPDNPSMSGARYLIVPMERKDEAKALSEDEWNTHLGNPCRLDLELLADERLQRGEKFDVRNRGRRTQVGNRSAAHVSSPALETDTTN